MSFGNTLSPLDRTQSLPQPSSADSKPATPEQAAYTRHQPKAAPVTWMDNHWLDVILVICLATILLEVIAPYLLKIL